ncbi:MAG: hypothetical protein M1817_003896 [Caeruleum heppii]|nr:MAG: hypothetical protein M1817_003896 [Caeruleum heppii]
MDGIPPWPYWKFELAEEDITSFHDEYNTCAFAIQDKDAFGHDLNEMTTKASSIEQLKFLLDERRRSRLDELKGALDSIGLQLIADPSLFRNKTTQWIDAAGIFRSQSLDALVRYFASFLPAEPPGRRQPRSNPLTDAATHRQISSLSPLAPSVSSIKFSSISSLLDREPPPHQPALGSLGAASQAALRPDACSRVDLSRSQQGSMEQHEPTSISTMSSKELCSGLRRSRRIAAQGGAAVGGVRKQSSRRKGGRKDVSTTKRSV